jgi:hypothetical protein
MLALLWLLVVFCLLVAFIVLICTVLLALLIFSTHVMRLWIIQHSLCLHSRGL